MAQLGVAGFYGEGLALVGQSDVRTWRVDQGKDQVVQRILVRHGFSRDLGALLIDDFQRAIAYFEKHPVGKSLSEAEAGSYNHSGR